MSSLHSLQCVGDWKYYEIEEDHEYYERYHCYSNLGQEESENVVDEEVNYCWCNERHINRQQSNDQKGKVGSYLPYAVHADAVFVPRNH